MLFQITKIYVWLSLSPCFSLRAERGGAVGVVWWCTEISEARWEIVSGALQVLTQHGDTHWCDTVTIASQQNIFYQRRTYRQLPTTLRRQNKELIEQKKGKKGGESGRENVRLPLHTRSLPALVRLENTGLKIRENIKITYSGFLNERNLKNGKQLKLGMERIGKTHFSKQGSSQRCF